MVVHLDDLPTELYDAILTHVPPKEMQQTVLALTRAVPLSAVPSHRLFQNISITHPEQAVQLDRRIRAGFTKRDGPPSGLFDASPFIQSLSIKSWDVDSEVLKNMLRVLPSLETLNLRVGPVNFTPATLQDMFDEGEPVARNGRLSSLELRFRPYVQKATYLSFLKGSYFDGTLVALSEWSKGLPTLSIVQDPDNTGIRTFAQPIVFHLLDQPLSLLFHSPGFARSLKSFRLRIPARPVVPPLTTVYAANQKDDPEHGKIIPAIEILDLSTCMVRENDIETILTRFPTLKHLILDGCVGLIRHAAGPAFGEEFAWWNALGRRCAMYGLKKARDKEKELKATMEALRQRHLAEQPEENQAQNQEIRRPRQGRKGLATATITIRGANALSEAGPLTRLPLTLTVSGTAPLPKVNVIPPTPTLRSLALHADPKGSQLSDSQSTTRSRIISEFEQGWQDGLRVIRERSERMSSTFRREIESGANSRYFKFKHQEDMGSGDGWKFGELVPVMMEDMQMLVPLPHSDVNGVSQEPPRLCLGGASLEEKDHTEGCGHEMASRMWIRDQGTAF